MHFNFLCRVSLTASCQTFTVERRHSQLPPHTRENQMLEVRQGEEIFWRKKCTESLQSHRPRWIDSTRMTCRRHLEQLEKIDRIHWRCFHFSGFFLLFFFCWLTQNTILSSYFNIKSPAAAIFSLTWARVLPADAKRRHWPAWRCVRDKGKNNRKAGSSENWMTHFTQRAPTHSIWRWNLVKRNEST